MMIASGTDEVEVLVKTTKTEREERSHLPGISSCIAKVAVSVVIKILSAAGSSIVPKTEDMFSRRARKPSS